MSYFRANENPTGTIVNNVKTIDYAFEGRVVKPPEVRYVLVVKPRIQYETELFQKLDFLLSRFATSPASLAWEKVPFSFVVDWFVDLRGFCRSIDEMLGISPFIDLQMTRSASYDVSTTQTWTKRSPCSGAVLYSRIASDITYRHYERYPVSPRTDWFVWRNRFGKNQAAISAALISQAIK